MSDGTVSLVRLESERPKAFRTTHRLLDCQLSQIDSEDDDLEEGSFLYVVPLEDMFDTLLQVHKSLQHGRRDAMRAECNKSYYNLTTHLINRK